MALKPDAQIAFLGKTKVKSYRVPGTRVCEKSNANLNWLHDPLCCWNPYGWTFERGHRLPFSVAQESAAGQTQRTIVVQRTMVVRPEVGRVWAGSQLKACRKGSGSG